MHTAAGRRTRRTALTTGAVAAVIAASACGPLASGPAATSSPDHEPVSTTTTTEPRTSTSSTTGDPPPPLPDGADLTRRVRNHMAVMNTVTITGTSYLDRVEVELEARGSTGGLHTPEEHAGASQTTLTRTDTGGTLELRALGEQQYVKADSAWFGGGIGSARMAKHAGRWVKLPAPAGDVNAVRPNRLLKDRFYGDGLTVPDERTARTTAEKLDGDWVHRLDIERAGKDASVPRTLWVAAEDPPVLHQVISGAPPRRETLRFSGWDETSEKVPTPTGAKRLRDGQVGDLL